MMSGVESVNELVRPVEHENSRAFGIMAVPDQMVDTFLCQSSQPSKTELDLGPTDAKYGMYYLSANQFNLEDEESATLLLLWTKEKNAWKVISWLVEVP